MKIRLFFILIVLMVGFGCAGRAKGVDGVFANVVFLENGENAGYQVGNIIRFGAYHWRVLYIEGEKMLLLSENVIERRRFHNRSARVNWQTSDMRRYLNNEFLNSTAFSDDDRGRIIEESLETEGGIYTKDRVFLLSITEVITYFDIKIYYGVNATENTATSGRIFGGGYGETLGDENNRIRIGKTPEGVIAWWWLRTRGGSSSNTMYVNRYGEVNIVGHNVGSSSIGVRPAVWVRI